MTTWRHANEMYSDRVCSDVVIGSLGFASICGCTAPTPDPTSPCGYEFGPCSTRDHATCGKDHEPIDTCHPHQPTRCTCGHAIEAAS